ncbi:putative NAD/FAD-binding protein [Rhodothalassium salexigens DSM 2132]|uniref:Putative NAD/FAD-binding protein n=1 Tax=Rhodothalassium salexigens DSM 2132 TaxID=1188247 RepID=A0A4R2PK86_RHOSA|nr:FAD-dependent oxidoreductase [Rhodothalassium salexigens]MBB4211252.1 hypothetical protein [Rhodothalassium salexigens DSM 2132]TCP35174.1 putative NAD/FAD-binding protein [Rhodothalassium salexigens DSM 2132]
MSMPFDPPSPSPVEPGPKPPIGTGRCRLAVIGSGISGLAAAYLLSGEHDVTLFEADDRLGGHSNTVDIDLGGTPTPVDTGFIVFNPPNYPHLTALFDHLGVATHESDMSFAASMRDGAVEYSSNSLFAQRRNLVRAQHWRMLADLVRFYRSATRLRQQWDLTELSLGGLLAKLGYSDSFIQDHMLPMAAAIWSTPLEGILDFPADSFIRFFDNHGLFKLVRRTQWRTVTGGSRAYVSRLSDRIAARPGASLLTATPVETVVRHPAGVTVKAAGRPAAEFDAVIMATHADTALQLLDQPSRNERRLLGTFGYEPNRAVLHRDPAYMPVNRRAWASWNYLERGEGANRKLALTYWMNSLQGLDPRHDVFVTLNPADRPRDTVAEFTYDHPMYSAAALKAQGQFASLQGVDRVWFCGAHFGYGFHEDGLESAIAVATDFGIAAPWMAALPKERQLAPLARVAVA